MHRLDEAILDLFSYNLTINVKALGVFMEAMVGEYMVGGTVIKMKQNW